MDISLDPIAFSDTLQNAGMPKKQADIIARTQEMRLEALVQARELVTKKDLELALANLKVDLIKWMFAMLLGFTTLIIGAFKFLS